MGALNALGGVLPALTGVATGAAALERTIGTARRFGSNPAQSEKNLALAQLKERQSLQNRQNEAQNTLEREKNTMNAAQSEKERRKALRRAVSRQRARFGAQGLGAGAGDGSSEAVLLGLFSESDDERKKREGLDHLRDRSLELDSAQSRSANLLQASQLAQRQKLERLF